MTYLRSLFLNFLIVFFVDRVLPGLEIQTFEQVPNIGADFLFSLIVGFLNASVFPFLVVLEMRPTVRKICWMTLPISTLPFVIISFIPFGVQVTSFAGFFFASLIVWSGAFFTNYLELKSASGGR